jgi:hypothetical protein
MAASLTDSSWLEWIAGLMGGKPRQRPAASFPPERYWCLLDELPWHLIPPQHRQFQKRILDRTGEFRLNPRVTVLENGQLPPEFNSSPELLENFALQGTLAWVRHEQDDFVLPFWLGPRLQAAVGFVQSEDRLPPTISDADQSALSASGLLIPGNETHEVRKGRGDALEALRSRFQHHGYAPVRGLIHPFHIAALRRYFRWRMRNGMLHLGDDQVARRYVAHNDGALRFFHGQLAGRVSRLVGESVKPSYVYLASYLAGAELEKHTDRSQCEFSLTLCLDYSPEPEHETSWPIRLECDRSDLTVYQAIGDALLYRGTRLPHYRNPLPAGHTSTSVFFHYVPQNFAGALD